MSSILCVVPFQFLEKGLLRIVCYRSPGASYFESLEKPKSDISLANKPDDPMYVYYEEDRGLCMMYFIGIKHRFLSNTVLHTHFRTARLDEFKAQMCDEPELLPSSPLGSIECGMFQIDEDCEVRRRFIKMFPDESDIRSSIRNNLQMFESIYWDEAGNLVVKINGQTLDRKSVV